jgi:hypothetical protein
MPDRLSLLLWMNARNGRQPASNPFRRFEKILRKFPFSKLAFAAPESRAESILRIHAVNWAEPPLAECALNGPPDVDEVLRLSREFQQPDSAVQLETLWDLWGAVAGVWKLTPIPVSLWMFQEEFERAEGEDFRIDFGSETPFLPPGKNEARIVKSNIQSLLQLVHDIEDALPVRERRLWTESGENFADKLQRLTSAT